jgi:AraC-like DNA-binding protein
MDHTLLLYLTDSRGPRVKAALDQADGAACHRIDRRRDGSQGIVRTRKDLRCYVREAIYNAGFNSASRFYETSSQFLGMRPTDYRAGGVDTEIRFAVGQCSLGSVLVAPSAKGVCAILLGDDADALVRDLQDRFPQAILVGGDVAFEQTVAKVVGCIEKPALGLDAGRARHGVPTARAPLPRPAAQTSWP